MFHKPITVLTIEAMLAMIAADVGLTKTQRRDMATDVRSFCRHLGLDPVRTEASHFTLRSALTGFHPKAANIGKKRWSNICSGMSKALDRSGASKRGPLPRDLTTTWREVRDLYASVGLERSAGRFVNFCNQHDLKPSDVDQSASEAFLDHLLYATLNRKPKHAHRLAVVGWNRGAAKFPELGLQVLAVPNYRDVVTLPAASFPASFLAELDEWADVVAGKRRFDKRRPRKPLRPATVEGARLHFLLVASALVRSGIPAATITAMAALVSGDNLERALNFLGDRKGGTTYAGLHNIAHTMTGMARHWLGFSEAQMKPLLFLKANTACRKKGMTPKNQERLRLLMEPSTRLKFYGLPVRLMSLAQQATSPKKAALLIQWAVAFEILIMTAMRMGNVVNLRLDQHLRWDGKGKKARLRIVVPGEEVKNSVPLEYLLPADSSRLIEHYIKRHIPVLDVGVTPFLFPGQDQGTRKHQATLAGQLKKVVQEELGIDFNPHLARHFAASVWLEAHPGQYEMVRRLLHDKTMDVILDNYSGPEVVAAMQHFDQHVLNARGKSMTRFLSDLK